MNSDSSPFVYTFENIPRKLENLLLDIAEDEILIENIEELSDIKWKFYNRASKIMIFNSDNQLITSDGEEVKIGNWQYMDHSNMLLLSLKEEGKTYHLIYAIVVLTSDLLIISPHQADKEDQEQYFEIYYASKKKPKVADIEKKLLEFNQYGSPAITQLAIGIFILLLIVLYFFFVY